jgi:hypothetical protein
MINGMIHNQEHQLFEVNSAESWQDEKALGCLQKMGMMKVQVFPCQ